MTLWSVSPLILGWGASICPDASAAALGLVGSYFFWRFLKEPNWGTALWAGTTLGLMILAKPTWILAFILYPVLWLISQGVHCSRVDVKRSLGLLCFVLALGVLTLNAGYFFRGSCAELGSYTFCSRALSGKEDSKVVSYGNRFSCTILAKVPVPLSSDFVRGLDVQKRDFERGFPTYFRGKIQAKGSKSYYFFVLACKEMTGGLLLCLVGATAIVFSLLKSRNVADLRSAFDRILPIIFGVALLGFVSLQDGASIPRYLLPALHFFYLIGSGSALLFTPRKDAFERFLKCGELFRAFAPILLCASLAMLAVVESVLQFPHAFSFYNHILFGETRGFHYVLDSGADWRQCDYYFADFCRTFSERRVYVSFLNQDEISRLAIPNADPLPLDALNNAEWLASHSPYSLIAVSVNDIYNDSLDRFTAVREVEPCAVIGGVLRVYESETIASATERKH